MNNFYASVECMLNPSLRDKAVAVCGSVEERHGIVLAKNYAAKAFGVSTGEAIWQAKQKCPNLTIVEPHYEQYMKFSRKAREIYGRYTDLIEPYGMDECWLDVTGSRTMGNGFEIADEIRRTITFELGLTISAGVSFNKIFAKLGSDMKKPDAVTCIPQETFKDQIWNLPASDMLGVGRATEKVLTRFGINTIGQLAAAPETHLLIQPDRVPVVHRRVTAYAVAARRAQQLLGVIQHKARQSVTLQHRIHAQPVNHTGADAAGPVQLFIHRLLTGSHHHRRVNRARVAGKDIHLALPDVLPDHILSRIHAPVPLAQAVLLHVLRHMLIKGKQFIQFLLCCLNQFHG